MTRPTPAAKTPSDAPRRAARDIVLAVTQTRVPMDLAWQTATAPGGPLHTAEARDRAFARLLATVTLRRLGQIDAILSDRIARPPAPATLTALRLGVAQLVFLETPPHAAVSATVGLARGEGGRKLTNAVLRRIAEAGAAVLDGHDAAWLNTPEWLWHGWAAAYGAEGGRRIAEAHMAEPPLDLTVKTATSRDAWAERLDGRVVLDASVRRPTGGRIEDLPGFADGAWWVQDAAAALPARLLAPAPQARVLDLCAAPGGKTAQLAAMGAQVTAVDVEPARLKVLDQNLARLGLKAKTVRGNLRTWTPPAPADAVLLDAPCSSTGTIRRHPDVAHLKLPPDIDALARLQAALLDRAAAMVAPGGRLIYCTCSLEPAEGEDQVPPFLDRHGDYAIDPVTPEEVGGLAEAIRPDGTVRTRPDMLADAGGLDGFYIARFRRT